ncbi:unnamed protein product, partial [Polarella glacialis]
SGGTAVLDGVHRLPRGTLAAALGRLCADRELDLPDGSRLVDERRLRTPPQHGDDEVQSVDNLSVPGSQVAELPTSFRVVALAEPGSWLTPEVAALFSTHVLPELTSSDLEAALPAIVPAASLELCRQAAQLVASHKAATASLSARDRAATQLSLRALLRALRRSVAQQPESGQTPSFRPLVREALLTRFLPSALQDAIEGWMDTAGLPLDGSRSPHGTSRAKTSGGRQGADRPTGTSLRQAKTSVSLEVTDEFVCFGALQLPRRSAQRPELIPAPRDYFSSDCANRAVIQILACEAAGERALLLMGNQGVGKNVAADRALQLLRAEREYVQLHRDTTVASLTVLPVLEDGRLRFDDAPLVRAVRFGRVCVLDEADKAPTEVMVVLRALVEDGELALGDGRRILAGAALRAARAAVEAAGGTGLPANVVPVHEDFRLWVLANRPGFPFHGNALFQECGDIFAALVIDNPEPASELALLEHSVPTFARHRRQELVNLSRAFADLRAMAERGAVVHPYSMREAVAVVRHLESFPEDDVAEALTNVLAVEAFDPPLRKQLAEAFEAAGVHGAVRAFDAAFSVVAAPGGQAASRTAGLSKQLDIRYLKPGEGGSSTPRTASSMPKHGKVDPTGAAHVGGNTWAGGSGGSDTAGLGGRGGPYRLWDGNPVHQVSDAAKGEVSAAQVYLQGFKCP